MKKAPLFYAALILVILTVVQACRTYYFRSNYADVNKLLHETANLETKPFLKAHLKNGDICIFGDQWFVDTTGNIINGQAARYNFNRTKIFSGNIVLPIDSVAIFETNQKLVNPEHDRIVALSILAGVDVLVGVLCIMNPKACFGSCPTFYINEPDNFHYAAAEGFSNAIAPSMEYEDIDCLNNGEINDSVFSITMKN